MNIHAPASGFLDVLTVNQFFRIIGNDLLSVILKEGKL